MYRRIPPFLEEPSSFLKKRSKKALKGSKTTLGVAKLIRPEAGNRRPRKPWFAQFRPWANIPKVSSLLELSWPKANFLRYLRGGVVGEGSPLPYGPAGGATVINVYPAALPVAYVGGICGGKYWSWLSGGVEGEGVPPLPKPIRATKNRRANRTSLRLDRFRASRSKKSRRRGGVRGGVSPPPAKNR